MNDVFRHNPNITFIEFWQPKADLSQAIRQSCDPSLAILNSLTE